MVKKGFLKTAVRSFIALFLTFSLIGGGVLSVGASHMPPPTLLEMKDKLLTFFIKNEGQIGKEEVKYYMSGVDGTYLFFLPKGIQLGRGEDVVHFSFYGGSSDVDVVGEEPLETRVNYFVGSDEGVWKRNVPTYGKVRYRNVYPGVDVVFYMTQEGRVEYDIIAQPGVNVSAVKFGIDGARNIELDENGDVRILLPSGDAVVQKAPQIYHLKENTRVKVEGKYRIEPTAEGGTLISFDLGERYDPRYTLVIDPVIVFSTRIGGSYSDFGRSVAVDAAGNVYVTGYTHSVDFPVVQGRFGVPGDIFLVKMNANGQILYSTYLGGSDEDRGERIVVGRNGRVYIVGTTFSHDFPVRNGVQNYFGGGEKDAVFAVLDANTGNLISASYFGGSGDEEGYGIAVDPSRDAFYITGFTKSMDLPVKNAYQMRYEGNTDAFLSRVAWNGRAYQVDFSTYLGGGGLDEGYALAVDNLGNVFVAGITESTNYFPITSRAFQKAGGGGADAFVTSYTPKGELRFSTLLGGSGTDYVRAIAVDSTGVYLGGVTSSRNFPGRKNAWQAAYNGGHDGFVTKMALDGSSILWGTYLGGRYNDYVFDLTIGANGNVYVTGKTGSTNFPVVNGLSGMVFRGNGSCYQDAYEYDYYDRSYYATDVMYEACDAFVVGLSSLGKPIFSTPLGGSAWDAGYGVRLDNIGRSIYVVGSTRSDDFPIVKRTYNGPITVFSLDLFVTKIGL